MSQTPPQTRPQPEAPQNSLTPRRRLASALRPRLTRAQLVAFLLLAVLGFALAVQLRANSEQGLSSLRQQDLVRILDDVSERSQRLQQEVNDLEATKRRLSDGSGGSLSAIEDARKREQTLAILAGTAPAQGPGIELTIRDDKHAVRASRLLDTVEELRDAGAEAMQIGNVRVVASTAFVDTGDGVVVDGVTLQPPYRLLVIGDPRSLSSSLAIPGGVLEVLRQQGAEAVVTQRDNVEVSALHAIEAPQYARPAPEATGGSGG